MKIECGKRKLSDGTTVYIDERAQKIYIGGVTECEHSYRIVFQPEKPPYDFKHEEFVKCLNRSKNEGYLTKHEMERRIRRGRPVTVWTKPIQIAPEEKKENATGDIDKIIDAETHTA